MRTRPTHATHHLVAITDRTAAQRPGWLTRSNTQRWFTRTHDTPLALRQSRTTGCSCRRRSMWHPTNTEAQASSPCLCLCNNQPPNQPQQWDLTQQAGPAAAALLQLWLQDAPAVRTLFVGGRKMHRSSPSFYQVLPAPVAPAALHRAWLSAALPSSPGDAALHPHAVCRAIDALSSEGRALAVLPPSCTHALAQGGRNHVGAWLRVYGRVLYIALAGCRCEVSCLRYLLLLMLLTTGSATGAR